MNRINIVCLGVRDMRRSLRFYKSIGFRTHEKDDNPPIVFFDLDGSKLELFSLEGLARDIDEENPPAKGGGFSGITLACNCKSEAEVDELLALAERSGGRVVKQAQPLSWGGYGGYFTDPDGYHWEVAYGAMWRFDDNNMLVLEPPQE